MSERILLAPAGWEPRFEEGVYIDIIDFKPSKILISFSQEYSERTLPFRNRIRAKAQSLSIEYLEFEHDYCDAVSLYKSLLKVFEDHVFTASKIRFNGTTAPRDLIWYALHFLSGRKIPTEFSYFRPLEYGSYLSRDARAPRFVLKRSGIAYPDQPTCVLALSGFDEERLAQLKQRYEPRKMLIGRQTGDQLGNKHRNISVDCDPADEKSYFDFDCYDTSDISVEILCEKLDELKGSYNVIAASLGPKPCAITLFKLTQLRPEIGLVYIPAGDYSENYSTGIELNNRTLVDISW
ncbi:hypothetical protein [Rhodoferax ferrireducens]|uniref:hypothetical protein n=1 Tax=Rhodoferax ferrireducens TaxID=192843 RepID=UPI003BB48FB2